MKMWSVFALMGGRRVRCVLPGVPGVDDPYETPDRAVAERLVAELAERPGYCDPHVIEVAAGKPASVITLKAAPTVEEAQVRLTALAAGSGATLRPYVDHNHFDQHDRLRSDLCALLASRAAQAQTLEALRAETDRMVERVAKGIASARQYSPWEDLIPEAKAALLEPYPDALLYTGPETPPFEKGQAVRTKRVIHFAGGEIPVGGAGVVVEATDDGNDYDVRFDRLVLSVRKADLEPGGAKP